MTKFKATSMSGFFLRHKTVEGLDVYPTQMKYAYLRCRQFDSRRECCVHHIAPRGRPMAVQLCAARVCAHAGTYVPAQLRARFLAGFRIKRAQRTGGAAQQRWENPTGKNPEKCTEAQMVSMSQYMTDFENTMSTSGSTYVKAGNGAFVHSCHTHCEAQNGEFLRFKIAQRDLDAAGTLEMAERRSGGIAHILAVPVQNSDEATRVQTVQPDLWQA